MKISIKTIPHNEQRYETSGDFWDDECGTKIRVSEMGNDDYEFLVALHELVELHLCKKRGILEPNVAAFDIKFESEREKGLHSQEAEPGDHIDAPYRKEHFFATSIERLMANELGVDWAEYERTIMEL